MGRRAARGYKRGGRGAGRTGGLDRGPSGTGTGSVLRRAAACTTGKGRRGRSFTLPKSRTQGWDPVPPPPSPCTGTRFPGTELPSGQLAGAIIWGRALRPFPAPQGADPSGWCWGLGALCCPGCNPPGGDTRK